MRRSEIQLAIMDGRTAALRLAHPCDCGKQRCELGDHEWESTRNMTPGPRAQSFEPAMANGHTADTDPPADTTGQLHDHYRALLEQYWRSARNLTRFIDAHRPDRYIPLDDPATDDQWCRNHLDNAGKCSPRYRGDLCSDCYELKLMYGTVPDRQCMQAIHEAGYKSARIINDWVERLPNKSSARKRRQRERERKRAQAAVATH